ncbi:MAG: hypothetical protein QNK18_19895 [Gammaproteobacteria bacterium]|nr:hypothetical protein [Gammaproteobacteria bacterium]MDJ0893442.1 hypothetical protein [Gammaproteobacteria bacterium]
MKSVVVTYFILGLVVNAAVWWAIDVCAHTAWPLDRQDPVTGGAQRAAEAKATDSTSRLSVRTVMEDPCSSGRR